MFNDSTVCPVWGREAGFSKEAEEASARIAQIRYLLPR